MPLTVHLGRFGPRPDLSRVAARAVVARGDRLLLLASRQGDVKFPGGGVEPGEGLIQALGRELEEECGAILVTAGEPVLIVRQCHRDRGNRGLVFEMTSYYLPVTIHEATVPVRLSPTEQELSLTPVWLSREQAREANDRALRNGIANPWVARENLALSLLPA